MRDCAADYGVIVCPMRLFSLQDARPTQIRLSFSAVEPQQIPIGVARLAGFVHHAARRL